MTSWASFISFIFTNDIQYAVQRAKKINKERFEFIHSQLDKIEEDYDGCDRDPADITIIYSGIGANKNTKHTPYEFLCIMNEQWIFKNSISLFRDSQFNKKFVSFTLNDWLEYSGAYILNE
jgi:hypothetical protein